MYVNKLEQLICIACFFKASKSPVHQLQHLEYQECDLIHQLSYSFKQKVEKAINCPMPPETNHHRQTACMLQPSRYSSGLSASSVGQVCGE